MFGNKRNLIFIIVIFVGMTVYLIARNGAAAPYSISVADSKISLTGKNDYSYSMEMSDIASLELTEMDDFGEAVTDGSDRNHLCGIYNNEQYGRYDLWILKKIRAVIVIEDTAGHTLVFNYEDARSTQELYKALKEKTGK